METANLEAIIIAPGVRETASEDGAVLLDIEQGICFSLNRVGLRIWEMLKRHYSVEQMIEALERDFPVSRSELLADISGFLEQLESKRLIRRGARTLIKTSWLFKLWPRKKKRPSTRIMLGIF